MPLYIRSELVFKSKHCTCFFTASTTQKNSSNGMEVEPEGYSSFLKAIDERYAEPYKEATVEKKFPWVKKVRSATSQSHVD